MDQGTAHRIEVLEAEVRFLRQALRNLSNRVLDIDDTNEDNHPAISLAMTALEHLEGR